MEEDVEMEQNPLLGLLGLESDDMTGASIVGFTAGTLLGTSAAVPWLYMYKGATATAVLKSAGMNTCLYSPLYLSLCAGNADYIAKHRKFQAMVASVATGGTAVSSFAMYYYPAHAPLHGAVLAAGIVCVAYNVLTVLVNVEQAEATSVAPALSSGVLLGSLGLSVYGCTTGNSSASVPFLALSSVCVPIATYFSTSMACGAYRSCNALLDPDTGLPLYTMPAPGVPAPDMSSLRKPRTSPQLSVEDSPPPPEFLKQTQHMFVIPNYKESFDLLSHTLEILMTHPNCSTRYSVLLAMEGSEGAQGQMKAEALEAKYCAHFKWIGHSTHVLKAGELAGKGSNLNAALRQFMEDGILDCDPADMMLTVLDADCIIAPEYIYYLDWIWYSHRDTAADMLLCPQPLSSGISDPSTFVRVWELLFMTFISGQLGRSQDLRFPLACYTMSMRVPEELQYWDPTLTGIGEDMHTALRAYIQFKRDRKSAKVVCIHVPYWSMPETSFKSKFKQQTRHILGCQDAVYSIQNSKGLDIADRIYVAKEAICPVASALLSPISIVGCNLICKASGAGYVKAWAFALSVANVPATVALLTIMHHMLYVWALSEGQPLNQSRSPTKALQVASLTPLVLGVQWVSGLKAELWLLGSAMGLTPIVYQGARQDNPALETSKPFKEARIVEL